jgi:hypothetical protein
MVMWGIVENKSTHLTAFGLIYKSLHLPLGSLASTLGRFIEASTALSHPRKEPFAFFEFAEGTCPIYSRYYYHYLIKVMYRTLKELDSTEGTVQLVDCTYFPLSSLSSFGPAFLRFVTALDVQSNSNLLHLEGTSILLVPQPSSDPNDPLRWPQWKKYVIFINICMYSFLNNCFIGGISSAFFTLSQQYGKSINTISGLLVYPILVLGLGVSTAVAHTLGCSEN